MTKPPNPAPNRWLHALEAFGRTIFAVMGTAGLGLIGGLCYGAREASKGPHADEFFAMLAWVTCLGLFGTIGFAIGLAVALLVLLAIWILRLAGRIARKIERDPAEGSPER